jgi:hypothetical protein
MEKLVKPNPKKEKKKQQQRKASRNLLFPNLHPKTAPHKLCQITKQRDKKIVFYQLRKIKFREHTRIAHEITKRGSIEEEENVPTKIQKILDTRPTHSSTASQKSTQFYNNNTSLTPQATEDQF